MEPENFSGKSLLSVYQGFHARILVTNIVRMPAFPDGGRIDKDNRHRKYRCPINITRAISKTVGDHCTVGS